MSSGFGNHPPDCRSAFIGSLRGYRRVSALSGKHAVVTGGGRGIGLAVARVLARSGAKVSVVSRSASDTGDAFFSAKADVSDEGAVAAAFHAAARPPVLSPCS